MIFVYIKWDQRLPGKAPSQSPVPPSTGTGVFCWGWSWERNPFRPEAVLREIRCWEGGCPLSSTGIGLRRVFWSFNLKSLPPSLKIFFSWSIILCREVNTWIGTQRTVTKCTHPCSPHPGQQTEHDQHFVIVIDGVRLFEISTDVRVTPRFADLTLSWG